LLPNRKCHRWVLLKSIRKDSNWCR